MTYYILLFVFRIIVNVKFKLNLIDNFDQCFMLG